VCVCAPLDNLPSEGNDKVSRVRTTNKGQQAGIQDADWPRDYRCYLYA